jgi:putative oxidoreductase
MDAALAIGRIVLVMIFIFSGLGKLFDISGTAAEIASKGLPLPQLLAVAAGIGETIGGLLIAVGWQTRLAAAGLIVFTAVAGFLFHDFWNLPAGDEQMNQMAHAFKNLSIIGGLIVLAAAGAGRWSVDGRGRRRNGAGGPAYSV